MCFDEDVVRCAAGSGVALRSFVIEVKAALWSNGPRDLAQAFSPGKEKVREDRGRCISLRCRVRASRCGVLLSK